MEIILEESTTSLLARTGLAIATGEPGQVANWLRWSEVRKRLRSLISAEMPEPVTSGFDDDKGLFEFFLGIGKQCNA